MPPSVEEGQGKSVVNKYLCESTAMCTIVLYVYYSIYVAPPAASERIFVLSTEPQRQYRRKGK